MSAAACRHVNLRNVREGVWVCLDCGAEFTRHPDGAWIYGPFEPRDADDATGEWHSIRRAECSCPDTQCPVHRAVEGDF